MENIITKRIIGQIASDQKQVIKEELIKNKKWLSCRKNSVNFLTWNYWKNNTFSI